MMNHLKWLSMNREKLGAVKGLSAEEALDELIKGLPRRAKLIEQIYSKENLEEIDRVLGLDDDPKDLAANASQLLGK